MLIALKLGSSRQLWLLVLDLGKIEQNFVYQCCTTTIFKYLKTLIKKDLVTLAEKMLQKYLYLFILLYIFFITVDKSFCESALTTSFYNCLASRAKLFIAEFINNT